MASRFEELEQRRAVLRAGGGEARIQRQHEQGKLTARERLELLLDRDSFVELGLWAGCANDELPGDGVVTGKGEVDGRPIFAISQDFTVAGGSVGRLHADKIVETMTRALRCGAPVVAFNDSGGARIQEGVDSLSGYGRIFYHNTLLSGVVPQIAVIAGPCAGGAAYSPALCDFVLMVRGTSQMFIAGPEVIRAATGEEVSPETVGGADAQASIAGNVHLVADGEAEAVRMVRQLLSYLPSNNLESPPDVPCEDAIVDDEEMDWVIPEQARAAYDVREVVERLLDPGTFFELQALFAPNLVIGFGRLGGMTVGLVANQPLHLGGALDIDASDKGARFIRACNVYNIPLVTLVDVPGFLPGLAQEHGGIIRHGAKMLFAYSAATVPKVTVVLRKAYGGAYLAMCSRDLGADFVLAWPTAEIAVMGPEGAVRVLARKELAAAADPKALLEQEVQRYRNQHANPFRAASELHVDDVVRPAQTRRLLIESLGVLRAKRDLRPQKKHGNIPM